MPKPTLQQAAIEAQRLLRAGRYRKALTLTTALRRAAPQAAHIVALHAEALLRVGMPRPAAEALDTVLAAPDPATPPDLLASLRVQRAKAAADLGRPDQSIEQLRAALQARPAWTEAVRDLAERLIDTGDLESAARTIEPLLQPEGPIDPGIGLAHARLCRRLGRDDDAADTLERVLAQPDPAGRPDAWSMLGACREAKGDHAGAFAAYTASNTATAQAHPRARPTDPAAWESKALDTLQRLDAPLPEAGPEDPRILLIVGVPRSGTSLIEQILAAHPHVGACGESQALPWVVSRLGPGAMGIDQARRAYRDELAASASRSPATLLTDKNPMNLFLLGMAARIIPGVRIVRVRRDPRDVCISCFASPLSADHAYARELDACRRFIASADRVMDTGAAVFEDRWHEVGYEDLVRDPEPSVRALLAHAGLAFDDRCLHPELEARVTRTISRDQVRTGIHDASVGRWRRFAEHFKDWPEDTNRPDDAPLSSA